MSAKSGLAFVVLVLLLAACSHSEPAPSGHVELVEAPGSGDLAAYVRGEVARGALAHVPVLVYVGATWCEPCRAFHDAARAGTLDATLGPLRLLEFDADRDNPRLDAAGYHSELVPLFARPGPDGRASGVQTEGARKGGNYVEQLWPRIKELIDRPSG